MRRSKSSKFRQPPTKKMIKSSRWMNSIGKFTPKRVGIGFGRKE